MKPCEMCIRDSYKADDREQLIVQELDLAEARLWREHKRPYLKQRRPECYL